MTTAFLTLAADTDTPCKADPDLWFEDTPRAETDAANLCRRVCPIRSECLAEARRMREPYGVWGAETPRERAYALGVTLNELRGIEGESNYQGRPSARPWTPEEDALVFDRTLSARKVADLINRPFETVKSRREKFLNPDAYEVRAAAKRERRRAVRKQRPTTPEGGRNEVRPERNDTICALRLEGLSLADISTKTGVSVGVIRGVLERRRVVAPPRRKAAAKDDHPWRQSETIVPEPATRAAS